MRSRGAPEAGRRSISRDRSRERAKTPRAQAARTLVLASLLFHCACAHSPPPIRQTQARTPPPLELAYDVTYRSAPHVLDVDLKLHGPARDFLFTEPGGVREITATVDGADVVIDVADNGRAALPPGTTRVRYRYALSDASSRWALSGGAGEPGSVLIAGRTYLIRPRVADAVTATLRISGAPVLLPWMPGADGVWHLSGVDLVDSGFHSFGGDRCTIEVEGATLEVAIHHGELRVGHDFLCSWLKRSAQEVLTVRRPFPHRRVAVHLMPVESDEASPFGMMLWSTPPSLAILVGGQAQEADFDAAWVAVHELLHLIHPSFLHQAPWIPEGLATYYQEVARMRSRRLTPEEGWGALADELHAGLEAHPDWNLQDAEAGLRRGTYQPLYWAGALIALELDVELRRATKGARTLDDALALLARRGATATVESFGRAIDDTAGTKLFDRVLRPHLDGPVFGEVDALLERLGIQRGPNGVTLVEAPDAAIRDAITSGSAASDRL